MNFILNNYYIISNQKKFLQNKKTKSIISDYLEITNNEIIVDKVRFKKLSFNFKKLC